MKKYAFVSQREPEVSVNVVSEDGQLVLSDALMHLRDAKAFADFHGAELVEDPEKVSFFQRLFAQNKQKTQK